MVVLGLVLPLLGIMGVGLGYPTGAPASTCSTMLPSHQNTVAMDISSPYMLEVDESIVAPGGNVLVSITGTKKFQGFLLQARLTHGSGTDPIGVFVIHGSEVQSVTCHQDNSTLTHTRPSMRRTLTALWRAPSEHVGQVYFIATVVESFSIFWMGITSSTLMVEGQLPSTTQRQRFFLQNTNLISNPLLKTVLDMSTTESVPFNSSGNKLESVSVTSQSKTVHSNNVSRSSIIKALYKRKTTSVGEDASFSFKKLESSSAQPMILQQTSTVMQEHQSILSTTFPIIDTLSRDLNPSIFSTASATPARFTRIVTKTLSDEPSNSLRSTHFLITRDSTKSGSYVSTAQIGETTTTKYETKPQTDTTVPSEISTVLQKSTTEELLQGNATVGGSSLITKLFNDLSLVSSHIDSTTYTSRTETSGQLSTQMGLSTTPSVDVTTLPVTSDVHQPVVSFSDSASASASNEGVTTFSNDIFSSSTSAGTPSTMEMTEFTKGHIGLANTFHSTQSMSTSTSVLSDSASTTFVKYMTTPASNKAKPSPSNFGTESVTYYSPQIDTSSTQTYDVTSTSFTSTVSSTNTPSPQIITYSSTRTVTQDITALPTTDLTDTDNIGVSATLLPISLNTLDSAQETKLTEVTADDRLTTESTMESSSSVSRFLNGGIKTDQIITEQENEIRMKVRIVNIIFTAELEVSNSELFQNVAEQIEKELWDLYRREGVTELSSVKVLQISNSRQGSVVPEIQLLASKTLDVSTKSAWISLLFNEVQISGGLGNLSISELLAVAPDGMFTEVNPCFLLPCPSSMVCYTYQRRCLSNCYLNGNYCRNGVCKEPSGNNQLVSCSCDMIHEGERCDEVKSFITPAVDNPPFAEVLLLGLLAAVFIIFVSFVALLYRRKRNHHLRVSAKFTKNDESRHGCSSQTEVDCNFQRFTSIRAGVLIDLANVSITESEAESSDAGRRSRAASVSDVVESIEPPRLIDGGAHIGGLPDILLGASSTDYEMCFMERSSNKKSVSFNDVTEMIDFVASENFTLADKQSSAGNFQVRWDFQIDRSFGRESQS